MDYKSQNNEVEIVINYFNGKLGTLLSLGENDGITLSNSYDLIHIGWNAALIEPVESSFNKLQTLYHNHSYIEMYNFGIGKITEITTFYETTDTLLATTNKDILKVWGNIPFKEIKIQLYSIKDALDKFKYKTFDFISIDCEGLDWDILQQMNLEELGCECICIEYSNNHEVGDKIKQYCAKFGLTKELLRNGENIILAK